MSVRLERNSYSMNWDSAHCTESDSFPPLHSYWPQNESIYLNGHLLFSNPLILPLFPLFFPWRGRWILYFVPLPFPLSITTSLYTHPFPFFQSLIIYSFISIPLFILTLPSLFSCHFFIYLTPIALLFFCPIYSTNFSMIAVISITTIFYHISPFVYENIIHNLTGLHQWFDRSKW